MSAEDLAGRMKVSKETVERWESTGVISYSRAQRLAEATKTAFGYLFLPEAPRIQLPLPDYRTIGSRRAGPPSPDLMDVIFQCQRRQDWFREYLQGEGVEPLPFVGSIRIGTNVEDAARQMRNVIGFHPSMSEGGILDDVLRDLINAADRIGIMALRSGIVGNNTHRKLKPAEFRGFALMDDIAPLIFINGADFKAAQVFTWAHEMAHVFTGVSALSNPVDTLAGDVDHLEIYCNSLAAEYLVPRSEVLDLLERSNAGPSALVNSIARKYRVSEPVVIRRLYDCEAITRDDFKAWYLERLNVEASAPGSSGGDFFNNQTYKIGKRFGAAVIASTIEGRTLQRDAMALLDMGKVSTFNEYAKRLKFEI
jgi:Zn-dependent peptidase ImmA (M78 family)/transcriptional regulator with XRE-family HTH domain